MLQSTDSLEQMRTDYDRVDFATIQDQIVWIHSCDAPLLSRSVLQANCVRLT